ncbi:MAG: septum formation initiator family protein [Patescibacteria group bacterium]|nr:septum formation initiator family protein [Patescibacteria group bacterium]MCL5257694.1 septum formation initiator family protein [Patescibacteria group bacterium]
MFRRTGLKFIIGAEILISIILAVLIIRAKSNSQPLQTDYRNYSASFQRLIQENQNLKNWLDYLKNPENVQKELKKKFGLAQPDEKVIIFPNQTNY